MRTAALFLCFILSSAAVFGAYHEDVSAVFKDSAALKDSQFSAYAKYVDGEEIIDINSTYRLAPASVLKLFTTAAAFDVLGPDFTYETKIYYDGEIKGKKLLGNIYIKGAGDPTLGSARFGSVPDLSVLAQSWAEEFKNAGINKIQGNIYADNSVFKGVLLPWRTTFQNIGNYYAAPADGLSVRDNSYEIYFSPVAEEGEIAEVEKTEPEMFGVKFNSFVKGDKTIRSESTYINFVPARSEVDILGAVPVGDRITKISAAMPAPAAFFAEYFKRALEANEIQVKGEAIVDKPESYEDKTLFLTYSSPALKEIVSYTNKKSFNLFADALLRSLSAYGGGEGYSGEGVRKEKEFLESLEIDTANFDVFDGSGLSRDNIVDCKITAQMLEKVLAKPYGEVFMNSLPLAGDPKDGGTMARRLRNSSAAYGTYAKTGSLDRVRSIAGYTKDHNGRRIVFCSIVNNYKGKMRKIDEVHDSFINNLADIGLKKKPAARKRKK